MPPIDKVGWIRIEGRKVLLVRTKGKPLFYTPGGKREEGEDDKKTLVREIKEELGVDLVEESMTYLDTFLGPADGRPGVMVQIKAYTADYKGTLVPMSEIEELAWLATTDAARISHTGQMILKSLQERGLID